MRKQIRPPEPSALAKCAEEKIKEWAAKKLEGEGGRFRWPEVDGKSIRDHILPTLREMNQGHCSFCDAGPLEAVSKEPIEHFRPKGNPLFHALAFTWSNLFYCCDRCQSTKGEQWDDGLLKPDDPDFYFDDYFDFDFTTGAIEPKHSSVLHESRANVTIRLYGLDSEIRRRQRRLELRKWIATPHDERKLDEWSYRDFLDRPVRPV